MIESILIENFKSIVNLSFDLGKFNVLIGENGCGKTNILEAIAFGAAASADKLDFEFLGSRGIRITNPDLMFSAFDLDKKRKSIKIKFNTKVRPYIYQLVNDPFNHKKWINKSKEIGYKEVDRLFKTLFLDANNKEKKKLLSELQDVNELFVLTEFLEKHKDEINFKDNFFSKVIPSALEKSFSNPEISNYIIYSPEESSLRKFEASSQIYPLGIKGEGLFQYLKELSFDKKQVKRLNQIKNNLLLLDWYEDFELPDNLLSNDYSLKIKDRFLNQDLKYFDQRSTNEGFLNLLFYSSLFISNTTPNFFAIDNIDASLNPKLCQELVKNLVQLTKTHKKQVIITTHNPAILDGLNLADKDQRLLVVRRSVEGHTKIDRVEHKTERRMKLSEIWINGFIGGLPENF